MVEPSGDDKRVELRVIKTSSQSVDHSRHIIHVETYFANSSVPVANGKNTSKGGIVLNEVEQSVRTDGADRLEERVPHCSMEDAVQVFDAGISEDQR